MLNTRNYHIILTMFIILEKIKMYCNICIRFFGVIMESKLILEILEYIILVTFNFIIPKIFLPRIIENKFVNRFNVILIILIGILSWKIYIINRILVVILYYYNFRHKFNKSIGISLFFTFHIFLAYETLKFFINSIFFRVIIKFNLYPLVYLILECLLVIFTVFVSMLILKWIKFYDEFLNIEIKNKTVKFINYMFVLFIILRMVAIYLISIKKIYIFEFDTTISLMLLILYLSLIIYLYNKQQIYLYNERIDSRIKENIILNEYITEINKLYNNIRGIRHDFAAIISSIEPALEREDINEIKDIYNKIYKKANNRLNIKKYSLFDLENIKDIIVRNILIEKLILCKSKKINMNINVLGDVYEVDIPMLEKTRLLNILLDNAIEAAENTENPTLNIGILSNNNYTEFIIENTFVNNIDINKIWEQNYSTKGRERGIGLNIISSILEDITNIDIETSIEDNNFIQRIKIWKI